MPLTNLGYEMGLRPWAPQALLGKEFRDNRDYGDIWLAEALRKPPYPTSSMFGSSAVDYVLDPEYASTLREVSPTERAAYYLTFKGLSDWKPEEPTKEFGLPKKPLPMLGEGADTSLGEGNVSAANVNDLLAEQQAADKQSAMQQLLKGAGTKKAEKPKTWQQRLSEFVDSDEYESLQRAAMILSNWNNEKLGELLTASRKVSAEKQERRLKEKQTLQQRQLVELALLGEGLDPLTARAASGSEALMNQLLTGKRKREEQFANYNYKTDTYLDGQSHSRFVPKPNTKEYNDRAEEHLKALNTIVDRVQSHERIDAFLDQAIELAQRGNFSVGGLSQVLAKIGGTDAAHMQELIKTIQGNSIVSNTAMLREKYGSLFGQLTEKETGYIQALIGLLSQQLRKEEFVAAIKNIKHNMLRDLTDIVSVDLAAVHFNLFQDDMLKDKALGYKLKQAEDLLNVGEPEKTGGYQVQLPLNTKHRVYLLNAKEANKLAKKLNVNRLLYVLPKEYEAWKKSPTYQRSPWPFVTGKYEEINDEEINPDVSSDFYYLAGGRY